MKRLQKTGGRLLIALAFLLALALPAGALAAEGSGLGAEAAEEDGAEQQEAEEAVPGSGSLEAADNP